MPNWLVSSKVFSGFLYMMTFYLYTCRTTTR